MRTLYLLRHAKSSHDDPTLADHDRPLAPRGNKATPVVADTCVAAGVVPDADDDLVLPGHPGRWMNVVQTWIQQHLADLLTGATAPRGLRSAVAAAAPRPIMLIVDGDALGGETTAGPRLQAAAPDTVGLWQVDGAPHLGGLATRPQQWQARVVGFLDRTLR